MEGTTLARVLVVEDEESFSDALSYMLRKEGFEVSVAPTGTSALTQFDRTGADIVLLDLMLPEMSGTEVCRQLTRGQLIDRVWGADYVGDTKTLDVHVKRLRSKVEPEPSAPRYIVTVRGLGYKFEP